MKIRLPTRFTVKLPGAAASVVLFFFLLACQPLGSPAALALFVAFSCLLCLLYPLPAVPIANLLAAMGITMSLGAFNLLLSRPNYMLSAFYIIYLVLMAMAAILLFRRIRSLRAPDFEGLIAWMLLADLFLNGPCIAYQLLRFGPGDMIQGFSGIFLGNGLSQNRTNSIRTGFIIILCLANLSSRHRILIRVSLAFNALCLLLATSMTTILSAIMALALFMFFRMNLIRFTPYGILVLILTIVSDRVNTAIFETSSVFDYLATINTRWIPKLDIYGHYFGTMVRENPVMLLTGLGIGTFANRFAILTNFSNYSHFPFKDAISAFFASPETASHLIARYKLEDGIVGASIMSVPWSSILSLLTEWGLVGLALLALAGYPWLVTVWKGRRGNSYARLLFMFFGFNLLFDSYLDFPETLFPFAIVAGCIACGDTLSDKRDAAEGV